MTSSSTSSMSVTRSTTSIKSVLLTSILLLSLGTEAASFGGDRRSHGIQQAGSARHASIAHAHAQAQAEVQAEGQLPRVQVVEEEGPLASSSNRRRHHTKASTRAFRHIKRDDSDSGAGCDYGTWQCVGLELQRCFDNSFQTLRTCPSGTVCSTDSSQTGCIWPFQADSSAGVSATTDEVVAATGGMQGAVGVDAAETSGVTAASSSASASASASATGSTSESSSAAVVQAAYAHGGHTSSSAASSSASSSYTDTWWTASTSTSDSWDSVVTASSSDATSTTDTWWTASTSTSSSASSTTKKKHHSTTKASSSSATSATSTGTVAVAVPTTGVTSNTGTGAPHWVIYSDNWLSDMPTTDAVSGYNRFILSFWLASGPADNAAFWESLSSADQIATVKAYNDAGVSIMVSAFGSTESPTTDGVDAKSCAQDLAAFVLTNNLNGVDVDYEDDTAFNDGQAEAWLITFQKELRNLLPSGEYLISHAPQAPWFNSDAYSGGGYLAIEAATADSAPIDFHNIQYYNQGDTYITCEQLLTKADSDFPGTSIFEIAANGVALDKLVIGKPIDEAAADNGYMTPALLSQCVAQAQSQSWNAGVMYWEYDSTAVTVMLAVTGGLVSS